jgi:phosphatidylserine/phosphatidylglycerophosphate/cardiolipin synthase-like enzyme
MLDLLFSLITLITPYDAELADAKVIYCIANAHKSIRICAYGLNNGAVAGALINQKRAGLDIKIVMDKTQASGKNQKIQVKRMKDAGIEIMIGHSPVHNNLIHGKFMIIDDQFVEDGSYNYTTNASEQVNTLNFSDDPERAKQFSEAWQKIWDYLYNKSNKTPKGM